MTTVNLDIGPKKRNETQAGVKGALNSNPILNGYDRYEYVKNLEGTFTLSGLSYGGQKFTLIVTTSIQNVSKVVVYFRQAGDTLLTIRVSTAVRHYYYTNHRVGQPINRIAEFDEFVTVKGKVLNESTNIKEILDSVVKNKRLNYDDLSDGIKEKLWRAAAVIFDLSKTSNRYNSDVTNAEVNVTFSTKIEKKYPKIQHNPTYTPFYIKGIKNTDGGNIDVPGGFPNDGLNEFNVHYKEGDNNHEHPLLITLNVRKEEGGNDQKYISSKYYISKNKTNTWDIRRVSATGIKDDELGEIIKNIENNERLNVELLKKYIQDKLKDLTQDLVIDIDEAAKQSEESGKYRSGDRDIPYKREIYNNYGVVSHADTFISFTIREIKVKGNEFISTELLPPNGTRLSRLKVFYNGNPKDNEPLLIYILYSDLSQKKWICRYSGDKEWFSLGSGDTTPASDMDSERITKLLEKLNIPNVRIDLSKSVGSYQPIGNILYFTVKNGKADTSMIQKYQHARQDGGNFSVKSVVDTTGKILSGISSPHALGSVSAFYSKDDPSLSTPLFVELEKSDENKYLYFHRETQNMWTEKKRDGTAQSGWAAKLGSPELEAEVEELWNLYAPSDTPWDIIWKACLGLFCIAIGGVIFAIVIKKMSGTKV
ncbi:hypothetical protein BEWA_038980 [Theileria equi strain WA]|uniref:Uncharacterized protein n=1 Tax=Theileria equi strain WA TaxID=1537102 RepID=L1LF43_THEEQ|nr:hypothetical protein BEWA_038980 [Theileria equi strain WA]EKX73860.1 hypothetical protein BEWA_038980 [Theileria equi strain WA]|eukprot:XP_004833312.1 hypothetical protein BEWA_038980 [Theileria equi strain WA]